MGHVDDEVFLLKLHEAGKQLEHASDTNTGLLQALDKVELCLSMVKQSPLRLMPQPLRHALRPSMNTLVEGQLLRHQDTDVRLLVLNCLSQITKITAPEEPYDDDVMKEILELLVGSFQDLGEMNRPSFARRVFILKNFEDVNVCTVMLKHGLYDLLCEMCRHFFAAVSHHSYSADIYDSMKKIMGFIVEKSDDISQELLSVFLINLRRDMRSSSPVAHWLAGEVVASCAETLRPYLKEKFPPGQAIHCNCLHGYDEIVHDMCRRGSQEINVNRYTTPAHEPVVADISTSEPTASLLNNSSTQVARVSPNGRHNESGKDKKMPDTTKSEVDTLVSLSTQTPPYQFTDVTGGRRRGRSQKRSEVKKDDPVSGARVETGSEGLGSPEETVGELANNVSVSRSSKRRAKRNSARKKRS